MPDKYVDIWKSKADNAPKQSIIGSLQKLLTEKDEQLYSLQSQLNALKERMAENVGVMEEMEKQFVDQKARIEELEQSGGSGGKMILKPNTTPASSSGGDRQSIESLRRQLSEMENKLYIMSQLPDRIQELEGKIEKQNKQLEQYEENEEKLRETIRKLSGNESADVMQELEQKVQAQTREIQNLQDQLENANQISISDRNDSEIQDQLQGLNQEKSQYIAKIDDLTRKNQDLLVKLEASRKTIINLQNNEETPIKEISESSDSERISQLESAIESKDQQIQELQEKIDSGQSSSDDSSAQLGDLRLQNQKLQRQLDESKEKYKQQSLKLEQLVEHVQQAGKGEDLAAQVTDLSMRISELENENAELKTKSETSEKLLKKQAGGDLIQSLNLKVERLTALNKKLEEEIKKFKSGATSSAEPKTPGPSVPKIQEISSKAPKGGDAKLNQELNQLRKQIAEKDAALAKANKESVDAQTALAQMKAAGPQDAGSGNMMNLLADLQTRNKKLKEEIRKKDEEIARLNGQ